MLGIAQKGKDLLLLNDVHRIIAAWPEGLLSLCDLALVLVGFAGAFRRSELASIYVLPISLPPTMRHLKTGQESAGREVAIPFSEHEESCPVRMAGEWMTAAAISNGRVFRGVDRHGTLPHVLFR
jgi:hypothetical protein